MKKTKFLLLALLAVSLAAGSAHAVRRFPGGDTGPSGGGDSFRRPRVLSSARTTLVLSHKYRGHANGCQPGQNCAGVVDFAGGHRGFKYGLYNPPSDMSYQGPGEDVGRTDPRYPGPEPTRAAVVLNKRNWQHMIVNHAPNLAMTKNFTIAMWIYPQSPNNWMGLVSKAERNDNYSIMFALSPSGQVAHFTNRTGWRWTQATVPPSVWTHVAVSVGDCNAQNVCLVRFYINGAPAPIDSRSGPSSIIPAVQPSTGDSNTGDLRIGSWFGPPSNESPGNGNFNHNAHAYGPSANPEFNFNGRIDSTKIWSGVLTDAQILQDFQRTDD